MSASTDEPSPKAERCSVVRTRLGVLLADPAAKAVLEKHFPGLSTNDRFAAAHDLTLRTLRIFAPEQFTPQALVAADAELPRRPAT